MKVDIKQQGRYAVGDLVRVLTAASHYYLLIGQVTEVARFNDSGTVTFTPAMLARAQQIDRVARGTGAVHFYWRELQRVIES